MSWNFTAVAKDKHKLKEHARKTLLAYHQPGHSGHALMVRVACQMDNLIDLFVVSGDETIKLETSGSLEGAQGYFKVDLSNYSGTFVE